MPIILCSSGAQTDSLTIYKSKSFIRQYFHPKNWKRKYEFIAIRVISVKNPDLNPMTFEVSLEFPEETIEVGTFSLYPPDRPGEFRIRIDEHHSNLKKSSNMYVLIKHNDHTLLRTAKIDFGPIKWE